MTSSHVQRDYTLLVNYTRQPLHACDDARAAVAAARRLRACWRVCFRHHDDVPRLIAAVVRCALAACTHREAQRARDARVHGDTTTLTTSTAVSSWRGLVRLLALAVHACMSCANTDDTLRTTSSSNTSADDDGDSNDDDDNDVTRTTHTAHKAALQLLCAVHSCLVARHVHVAAHGDDARVLLSLLCLLHELQCMLLHLVQPVLLSAWPTYARVCTQHAQCIAALAYSSSSSSSSCSRNDVTTRVLFAAQWAVHTMRFVHDDDNSNNNNNNNNEDDKGRSTTAVSWLVMQYTRDSCTGNNSNNNVDKADGDCCRRAQASCACAQCARRVCALDALRVRRVRVQWCVLRRRVLCHARVLLRDECAAQQRRWRARVQPLLLQWAASTPATLVETFAALPLCVVAQKQEEEADADDADDDTIDTTRTREQQQQQQHTRALTAALRILCDEATTTTHDAASNEDKDGIARLLRVQRLCNDICTAVAANNNNNNNKNNSSSNDDATSDDDGDSDVCVLSRAERCECVLPAVPLALLDERDDAAVRLLSWAAHTHTRNGGDADVDSGCHGFASDAQRRHCHAWLRRLRATPPQQHDGEEDDERQASLSSSSSARRPSRQQQTRCVCDVCARCALPFVCARLLHRTAPTTPPLFAHCVRRLTHTHIPIDVAKDIIHAAAALSSSSSSLLLNEQRMRGVCVCATALCCVRLVCDAVRCTPHTTTVVNDNKDSSSSNDDDNGDKSAAHYAVWCRTLLADVYTAPLLLRALSWLTTRSLACGDVPLARVYGGAHVALLARTPSRAALRRCVQTLQQLACVLARGGCVPVSNAATVVDAAWRHIASAPLLQQQLQQQQQQQRSQPTSTTHGTLGAAFDARRRCFAALCGVRDAAYDSGGSDGGEDNDELTAERVTRSDAVIVVQLTSSLSCGDASSSSSSSLLCVRRSYVCGGAGGNTRESDTTATHCVSNMSCVHVPLAPLHALAQRMRALHLHNRQQLLLGVDERNNGDKTTTTTLTSSSTSFSVECSRRCHGSSTRPTLSSSPSPQHEQQQGQEDELHDNCHHEGRRSSDHAATTASAAQATRDAHRAQWWAARHALDARVRVVVRQLRCSLAPWHVVLLGDVTDAPARARLWRLSVWCAQAMRAHTQCEANDTEEDDGVNDGVRRTPSTTTRAAHDTLQHCCYMLLQGLPQLIAARDTREGDGDSNSNTQEQQQQQTMMMRDAVECTSLPYCDVEACAVCACVRAEAAVTLLCALLTVMPHNNNNNNNNDGDDDSRDELDKTMTRQLCVCRTATRAALRIFRRLAQQQQQQQQQHEQQHEQLQQEHVDVLRVLRTHVHLVMDTTLHALPWEGVDVRACRGDGDGVYSTLSRVPSLRYVVAMTAAAAIAAAQQQHDGCAVAHNAQTCAASAFARAYICVDATATRCAAAYAALTHCHAPHWQLDDVALYTRRADDDNSNSSSDGDDVAVRGATNAAAASASSLPLLHRLLAHKATAYVYIGHRRGEQLLSRAQLYERVPLPYWQHIMHHHHQVNNNDSGSHVDVAAAAAAVADDACVWGPLSSSLPPPTPPPMRCHRNTLSAVLLMGCGSARLLGNDMCEAYGMPYAYLHAGAAAFVGCLCDITDGEADRLTQRLLTRASSAHATTAAAAAATRGMHVRGTLAQALADARRACRLPYLSGLATVHYGVDVPL